MIIFNKFEKKLLAELESYGIPEKGSRVIVGLSGGADSVSLLMALKNISVVYPLDIVALHLNHLLRDKESQRDMDFARGLCATFDIPFHSKCVDVNKYANLNKMGTEEAARDVRYKFFNEFSENNQIDYILTAHNKNDLAETILFHIIRGTGVSGLKGISRQRGNIIRPLLSFDREEIEQYCKDINVSYVTDSSNCDINYSRNYIRHVIIPEMKKINPKVIDSLYRLSHSVSSVDKAFDKIDQILEDQPSISLDDEALFRRAKSRFGVLSCRQLTHNRISALKEALNNQGETILSFPDNVECVVKDGDFCFRKPLKERDRIEPKSLKYGENIINDWLMIEISNEIIKKREIVYKNSTIYPLNCDTIEGEIFVRSREEGDKIRLGKMTKSLKKMFIEKKIPRDMRDLVPIICDDKDILLVPKIGIADKVKNNGHKTIYIGIHSREVF